MYPIDLFLLSKTKPLNIQEFCEYLQIVSKSQRQLRIRDYERNNLYQFIELLKSNNVNISCLNGFYYSYTIDQIGKEFDLIKICKNFVLNIEIKSDYPESRTTSEDRIKEQLVLNKHYLKNINDKIESFTYVAKDNKLFHLNDNNELLECSIEEICNIINGSLDYVYENLDDVICPTYYLVSPFNDVEKFINNEYFLTNQQENIKKDILKSINDEEFKCFRIIGDAGTGKTLLMYDIAKTLSSEINVCIVHCGKLNSGHHELLKHFSNIDIISAKELRYADISKYKAIFIDESQRIYWWQFEDLIKESTEKNIKIIFNVGLDQIMQESEKKSNINGKLDEIKNLKSFNLSTKIRSNEKLASFIKNLVNLKEVKKDINYDNVETFYVSTTNELRELLQYLSKLKYKFISFTPSKYKCHEIDEYLSDCNTHDVIGQEFDNVVMVMGQNFEYVNDRLSSRTHPNPDYIFSKLFYQGITRARLKLAIVVLRNIDLYKKIVKIKENKEE